MYEKAIASIDTNGNAVMNPANSGFLPDSHDAKTITQVAMVIFKTVKNIFLFLIEFE